MPTGIIYVFTNEAMPELVKIGFTTNESVEDRLSQLSAHAGVPMPFECFFAAEVEDVEEKERLLHGLFDDKRINKRREFFRIEPEKAVTALRLCKYTDRTPGPIAMEVEDKNAIEAQKVRRSRISLSKLGIREGDTLDFSRDDTIHAIVRANNKIEVDGIETSLSASALEILNRMGYKKTTSVSGSDYWIYDGELLDERRRRFEEQEFSDHSVG
jgi:hypothetical protein